MSITWHHPVPVVVESDVVFWCIFAAVLLGAVVPGLGAGLFAVGAFHRGRTLGYDPAVLVTALLVVLAVSAAAPAVVAGWTGALDGPSPVHDVRPLVLVAGCFLMLPVAAVPAWAVIRSLPERTNRRPGVRRRRRHYRLWGHVTGVLTAAATLGSWLYLGLGDAFRVMIAGLTLTLALRRTERRYRTQTEKLPDDLHGHVLYLRPFLTENRALFRMPGDRAEFTGQGVRSHVALDEFLARDITSRIGPFVALGNPSEVLPPGGAVRVYLDDDGWQPELERLARAARALVMEPGRTKNLRWELEYVARERLQSRLFVITPPSSRSGRWTLPMTRAMDTLTGWHNVTWDEFVTELKQAELVMTGDDPGPGAVVSFDRDGSSVVLARGLRTPAEFVAVIAGHTAAARR